MQAIHHMKTILLLAAIVLGIGFSPAQAQFATICCCETTTGGDVCLFVNSNQSLENMISICEGNGGIALPATYETGDTNTCQGNATDGCASICATSLPVELSSIVVLTNGSEVVIVWSTASETDNAGFAVEQEVRSGQFTEIGYVEGHGTTNEPEEYSFAVKNLDPGLRRFRLKQIDFDGTFEYSPVVETAVTVPERFLIEPAYPNPFNPTTTLRFAVAVKQHVEVTLVNAVGQVIKVLYSGTVSANEMRELRVDGESLPSGTYMVQFESNNVSATERIVLAK